MKTRCIASMLLSVATFLGLAVAVASAEVKQYRCRICGKKYELTHPLPEQSCVDAVTQNELFCASCSEKVIWRTDVILCSGCGKELYREKAVPIRRGLPQMLPLEAWVKEPNVRVVTEDEKIIIDWKTVKEGEMLRYVHTGNDVYQIMCFKSTMCEHCKRARNLRAVESFAENAGEYLGRFTRGLGSGLLKGIDPKE